MNELDELRIKVAELRGWTHFDDVLDLYPDRNHWWPPGKQNSLDSNDLVRLPNWPSDLNACAEFRKHLNDSQRTMYVLHLAQIIGVEYLPGITGSTIAAWKFLDATATDHCHAFISTMEDKT